MKYGRLRFRRLPSPGWSDIDDFSPSCELTAASRLLTSTGEYDEKPKTVVALVGEENVAFGHVGFHASPRAIRRFRRCRDQEGHTREQGGILEGLFCSSKCLCLALA